MSFQAILGTTNSPDNQLTKVVENKTTYDITLKDECSLSAPTILLRANIADVVNKNYLEIPNWSRKYFIRNITSVRDSLVRIEAEIDSLSTYAEQIRAGYGVVTRSQDYNHYIPDPAQILEIRKAVVTLPFASGFSGQTAVLTTAGPAGIQGGNT